MNLKKTGFFVVVITLLFATGWYLFLNKPIGISPNPTNESTGQLPEVDDWVAYTNNKMKFKIKYPRDWVVIATSPEDESFIAFDKNTHIDGREICIDMGCKLPGVIIAKIKTSTSEYISGLDRFDRKILEREDINIAGKRYTRLLTYSVPNQNNEYEFLYQKNESLFSFSSIYGGEYLKVLEKLLSTFEALE